MTGASLRKRPLPALPLPDINPRKRKPATQSTNTPKFDVDGYLPPPRGPRTVVIKVTATTPLMVAVRRVNQVLDTGPQKTKGLPLASRLAAMKVREGAASNAGDSSPQRCVTDGHDDVVLIATGRAIERALEAGAYFLRNKELIVVFRTRSMPVIDDICARDDAEDGKAEDDVDIEDSRVRYVSCVEVGIRWVK